MCALTSWLDQVLVAQLLFTASFTLGALLGYVAKRLARARIIAPRFIHA